MNVGGPANAESNGVVLPPDKYADVYEGALCEGLYGNVPLELCGSCPVRERCHALYEDLQFGSLAAGTNDGRVIGVLTGNWAGHTYDQQGRGAMMRDGSRVPIEGRPERPAWAR